MKLRLRSSIKRYGLVYRHVHETKLYAVALDCVAENSKICRSGEIGHVFETGEVGKVFCVADLEVDLDRLNFLSTGCTLRNAPTSAGA